MINVSYGNREFNDIYVLYKKTDYQKYLKNEIVPSTRFRAHDYIDYHTGMSENLGVSHTNLAYLTIRTNARLDFNESDIVVDLKNKSVWRIADNGITISDDNQMKKNSMRPRKLTILNLIKKA